MQKWTTSKTPMVSMGSTASVGGNGGGTGGVNKVSLSKILSIRPNLNEIECWALLGQTAHALQDVLLKANGHFGSAKKINDGNCPVIYPKRVLATTTGRIVIDNNFADAQFDAMKPEFIHPMLKTSQLYRDAYRLVLTDLFSHIYLLRSTNVCTLHCMVRKISILFFSRKALEVLEIDFLTIQN